MKYLVYFLRKLCNCFVFMIKQLLFYLFVDKDA